MSDDDPIAPALADHCRKVRTMLPRPPIPEGADQRASRAEQGKTDDLTDEARALVGNPSGTPAPAREPAELLPCPFCGGEAGHGTMRYSKAHVNEQGWFQDEFYFVNCIVCGSNNKGIVGFDSPERAIAAWNRRTPA